MNDFKNAVLAQIVGGILVAVVVFFVTLPFKNTLEQLTTLAVSIEKSVTAITAAANIDPEKIEGVSGALKNGSEVVGDGVGTGAATAIERIKGALNNDD